LLYCEIPRTACSLFSSLHTHHHHHHTSTYYLLASSLASSPRSCLPHIKYFGCDQKTQAWLQPLACQVTMRRSLHQRIGCMIPMRLASADPIIDWDCPCLEGKPCKDEVRKMVECSNRQRRDKTVDCSEFERAVVACARENMPE
jgi:hypothetical protein